MKHYKIEFDAEWGSEFQEETHLKMLSMMFSAWLAYAETTHKKNKIDNIVDNLPPDIQEI